MINPYAGIEDYQFWRRAVSRVEPHMFDPVVSPKFKLDSRAKLATAGSCFAQHISRQLMRMGFNYFVTERGEHLSKNEQIRRNYGVFSARYGNLYTVRQLLQLFDEAFDERRPLELSWTREDGRLADPYRPQIEPAGFSSEADLQDSRRTHLAAVRDIFTQSDVLVFTLGLTEAWRSKRDGSVFPSAPGVVAGSFSPEKHEFVNFTLAEVNADLNELLAKLRRKNPQVKVLLTVSPVPLIATYEDRHVVVSTAYSKAVLRVVAGENASRYEWLDYFPSFEIITGSNTGGLYYEPDYREVNSCGIAHATRCFVRNYILKPEGAVWTDHGTADVEGHRELVCDEQAIDAIRI
jgi:hypothetical protein